MYVFWIGLLCCKYIATVLLKVNLIPTCQWVEHQQIILAVPIMCKRVPDRFLSVTAKCACVVQSPTHACQEYLDL